MNHYNITLYRLAFVHYCDFCLSFVFLVSIEERKHKNTPVNNNNTKYYHLLSTITQFDHHSTATNDNINNELRNVHNWLLAQQISLNI